MLSASAYSFRLKSRLAISLSWIGGYTNVIAFLATGMFVSHATGNSTQFGRWLAAGEFRHAWVFGYLVLAFVCGAALSALLTESARRRGWRSKYVLPVGVEALLLAALSLHLNYWGPGTSAGVIYLQSGLASVAMGLQNATITRISGAVVRTTHLTGIFTDFGLEGVQYLFWWGDKLATRRADRARRLLRISARHPSTLRLLLLLSIAGSFGFGTIAGAFAYARWPTLSMLPPILFLMWIIVVDVRTPIADIRELDLLNDPELRLQGIVGHLLPEGVALYRASYVGGRNKRHRAPDFQTFVDRVPGDCRVIVLAVSPLTRFDANAVLDLQAAVTRLRNDKRTLILAGVTPHQFKDLANLGVAGTVDPNDLCPDLEFAIARAIVLSEEFAPARPAGLENPEDSSRVPSRAVTQARP